MPDLLFGLMVLAGALVVGGGWVIVYALVPREIRLSDALLSLEGQVIEARGQDIGPTLIEDSSSRLELAGAWIYQHGRLPLPAATARALTLQGRSIGDYFVNKLVLAVGGLVMPGLLAFALRPVTGSVGGIPLAVGLVFGLLGWFWPDIAMRNQQRQANSDAEEALNSFFDLVVLERLANLSAAQALEAAARLSDVPVFVRIRGALERARLEQRPPWSDLHALARDLDLPPIADMADVMQLDSQGASLADVLSSRVRELRDAHLGRERTRAHEASERMTLWMSIPVLVFAMAFLIPPLLTMAGS